MREVAPSEDRYALLRKLGEGGAGVVWLVEDRLRPGARLALKVLAEPSRGREAGLRREFATLAALRHPNLAEVHELDLAPGTALPRFSLEYVEGDDIVAAVRRDGPALLIDMAAEALRALAFLHDFGLIHRDLKPANLLVRSRPRLGCRLVLLDFGLALRSEMGDPDAARAAGTLPYMAPEVLSGAPANRRSDLYALGTVLFEAAHGRPPFILDGDLARFVESVQQGLQSMPALPAGYPTGLSHWLAEMLSTDPSLRPAQASEALARLNAACGSSYPAEVPASRAARLASGPPPGRDGEIVKLWERLTPSAEPGVVWLCGGPGMGKTRLLRWLGGDAVLREWDVLAPPSGTLFEERSGDGRDGVATELEKLRAKASTQPTLLLLDEVDSAGGAVARLLERVAREGKAPPLRVVAALRPAEVRHPTVRRLLADTGTVPTLSRLDLDPLEASGIRALAERATGSTAISEARVKWLLEVSEGSPLVAEALLVQGIWEKGGRGRATLPRPDAVLGRLELLSEQGRVWLESLAVLGPGAKTAEGILGKLSGLDEVAAREAAEEVSTAGLARWREGRWAPEARATAEYVLARIGADRKHELHRLAASLLLEVEGPAADPWRLARLWSGAGERERTVECALRAAQQSQRHGDPVEAAERYAFALRHLERRDPRRRALRLKQAEALSDASLDQAAARAYGGALHLSRGRGERADALARQALALARAGRFTRAQAAAEEALKLSHAARLRVEEARAKQALGMVLARVSREAEALPFLEQAVEVFGTTADPRRRGEALQVLAACKANLYQAGAEADYLAAIDILGSSGQGEQVVKSLIGLASLKRRTGRLEEAEQHLLEARRIARERGNLLLHLMSLSWLAIIAIEQGKLDHAISLANEAEDQALHLGNHNEVLLSRSRLAEALIGCGRPAEAAALLRTCLEGPLEMVQPESVDYVRMLLALALLNMPTPDDLIVKALLEKSVEGCRRRRKTRPLLMALTIEMERRARPGCLDPFEPIAVEFHGMAEADGSKVEAEILVRAGLARAAYLFHRGNFEGSRDAANAAAEQAERSKALTLGAQARALLSEALDRLQRGDDAVHAAEQGRALLEEAARKIEDPAIRQGLLDRPEFRRLREHAPVASASGDKKLRALYEMIRVLNSETDADSLLESILDMALREVGAERGMILLRDEGNDAFSVHVARNLDIETEEDAQEYSRHIVAQAGAGRSVLALDAGHDDRFRDLKSVSLYGIRSLMCVPLRSRGKIIGTVYLDSRHEGALFTAEDLKFLEAFADHAALALENVRKRADLEHENRRLQAAAEARVQLGNLVGRSTAMQQVFNLIEKVTPSNLPVLIQGESGTGKELVARAIHHHGPRRRRVFLSENCAAIPESLLESELFGVVRGAFTGAEKDRAGLFEQADGGTLFLDEIGDMSPGMQSRLLRVLQEGELRRVGGDRVIKVNVRVLAATNRDLQVEAAAGRFRQDLLYRLQVLLIQLPPLRERPGDVSLLCRHLLERISRERARPMPPLDREVLDLFERYSWPGNVRQLENALQRLALLAGDGPVTRALVESEPDLGRVLLAPPAATDALFSLERSERDQIERALRAAEGNRNRAARLLGVSRATIYRKIKEFDLG